MQTRRKTLSKNTRKHILFLHVLFSALWIGAGLSMQLIMFLKDPQNIKQVYAFNLSVQIIDKFIIIAAGVGTMLSGLLLS